jgi:FkbM family methyltransferase
VANISSAQNEDLHTAVRTLVERSSRDAFFEVDLNCTVLRIPRDSLRTMTHRVEIDPAGSLLLRIEMPQVQWVMERLAPGTVFLDVGAASGAICLPIAKRQGKTVRIVAFEPSNSARDRLVRTIVANSLDWVEVRRAAVSDAWSGRALRNFPKMTAASLLSYRKRRPWRMSRIQGHATSRSTSPPSIMNSRITAAIPVS